MTGGSPRPRAAVFAVALGVAVSLLGGCREDSRAAAQGQMAGANSPEGAPALSVQASACRAALASARPTRAGAAAVRIGSFNVRWFPASRSRPVEGGGTDIPWLACEIARERLDLVAVQEFVQNPAGRRGTAALLAALEEATSATWHARFDSCPDDGRQHVGFIFREDRVQVPAPRTLARINPDGSACAHQLRPGLLADATFDSGLSVQLLTVHLDSGTTARDRDNRRESAASITRALSSDLSADHPVVVLGDFNTMGCDRCPAPHDGGAELSALEAALEAGPRPLRRVVPDLPCSAYYRGRPTLLDHVFATTDLPPARLRVEGACLLSRCGALTTEARVHLDALSDHCPLVLEITPVAGSTAPSPSAR